MIDNTVASGDLDSLIERCHFLDKKRTGEYLNESLASRHMRFAYLINPPEPTCAPEYRSLVDIANRINTNLLPINASNRSFSSPRLAKIISRYLPLNERIGCTNRDLCPSKLFMIMYSCFLRLLMSLKLTNTYCIFHVICNLHFVSTYFK